MHSRGAWLQGHACDWRSRGHSELMTSPVPPGVHRLRVLAAQELHARARTEGRAARAARAQRAGAGAAALRPARLLRLPQVRTRLGCASQDCCCLGTPRARSHSTLPASSAQQLPWRCHAGSRRRVAAVEACCAGVPLHANTQRMHGEAAGACRHLWLLCRERSRDVEVDLWRFEVPAVQL